MVKKIYSTIVFLLTYIISVAQSVTVQAPRSVVEGNIFQVVYQLENARAEDIKVGKIEGCTELNGPGVTTSSSITIINGKRTESSSTGYAYTYRAIKAGEYTIPAATLVVNGKNIQSKPASIKVLPPDSNPVGGNQSSGSQSSPSTQSPSAGSKISASDIFVRIIFNKSHVYVGEAVECTLKLYTRYNSISGIQPHKLPIFDGFLIEEVDNANQNNEIEHYNGQNYLTAVLKKYILFPQKDGKLSVTSGEYTVGVTTMQQVSHGFWGYTNVPVEQDVDLKPTQATLVITPLPQPAPDSFNGAVGKFTLESRISGDKFRTNEAASITTIITGTGNIKYIKSPEPQLPVDFEQYTPSDDVRTHVAGNTVTGTVTSEFTFVPQSVGDFDIAPVEFSYFDPSSRDYVTLTAGGYELAVERGASSTIGSTEQNEITQRATDILHIHRLNDHGLNHNVSHRLVYNLVYWSIWILLIVLVITGLFIYRKELNRRADVVGLKTARAGRVAKKRLRVAKSYMSQGNKELFYNEILTALWGYISDRLVIPVSDLTRTNISDKLSERGMSQENIVDIINILDECEMARYTPDASLRSPQEIYQATSDAMDNLETITK